MGRRSNAAAIVDAACYVDRDVLDPDRDVRTRAGRCAPCARETTAEISPLAPGIAHRRRDLRFPRRELAPPGWWWRSRPDANRLDRVGARLRIGSGGDRDRRARDRARRESARRAPS